MKNKLLVLSLLILSNFGNLFAYEEVDYTIKMYCCYTPSHAVLKDNWFLPSIQDDFEIVIQFFQQECSSASFKEEGWKRTTLAKVDMIIKAIEENWNKIFIYSDVDIQFFKPIKMLVLDAIEGKDLVIQRNNPKGEACTGFFACRANERTLQLWKKIRNHMYQKNKSDQLTFNKFARLRNPYDVIWELLPVEFFGAGTLSGKRWRPNDHLVIPEVIVLHHANYTTHVPNKIAQLEYVKTIVLNR